MADWDEIKRLAADFQRTQTSDTLQRISERNCIDIVKKLTDLNLIELIYTCDGKEFLTPNHLSKEIEDEVYINSGRMHLHDLATNLNVDYQHVENKTKELARDRPEEYSLILGQIIHSTYKNTLGKQISDCMLFNGQLSIADFAKSLDLPSEFLLTIVKEILPKAMDDYVVSQDGRTYYTTDTMDKYKSIIAGTLSAISRPTSIASLMKRLDIPERIFVPIVDELLKEGRIDASVENRLFIPAVYAREQNEYINTFYNSNSYISYDVLLRMDIKQPKVYLKKRFPTGIPLKTCFISPDLLSQVESLIEDSISSNSWLDITSIVPSAIEVEDIEMILQDLYKSNKQFSSSSLIFDKTNICSLGYIATCKASFDKIMQTKAQEDLKQGKLINHFLGAKVKENKTRNLKETAKPKDVNPSSDDQAENVEPKVEEDIPKVDSGDEVQQLDSRSNKKDKRDRKSVKLEPVEQKEDDFDEDQRGKRSKGKKNVKLEQSDIKDDYSDDEQGGKKSKSRKSGGGSQGREIKQKATKKKYIPGNKGGQKNADQSDEETFSKTPRSNKGRAARRGMSPERPTQSSSSKSKQVNQQPEPLVFMDKDEIIDKLKLELRSSEEISEEFFGSIADLIHEELNSNYRLLAKQVLDEFLKRQSEDNSDADDDDDVELVD